MLAITFLSLALSFGVPRNYIQNAGLKTETATTCRCREEMLLRVGRRIRATSSVWTGKEAQGITYHGCALYLREIKGGPSLDSLGVAKPPRVTVWGRVGHYPGGHSKSATQEEQIAPEYFFVEVERIKVVDPQSGR